MQVSKHVDVSANHFVYPSTSVMESSSNLFFFTTLKNKGVTEEEFLELQNRIQEEEKTKFGHELHDGVNSLLAIAKIYLEHIHLTKGKEKFAKEQAYLILVSAIENIRNLSAGLVVSQKIDSPLLHLITDLITRIRKLKLFKISFKHSGEPAFSKIGPRQKLMIFRILQEQMNNIIKHSKATHVCVQLICGDDNAILEVSDDGIGFDTEKINMGTGMSNIFARINQFHGAMEIKSSPGKGCSLKVTFPTV